MQYPRIYHLELHINIMHGTRNRPKKYSANVILEISHKRCPSRENLGDSDKSKGGRG